MLASYLLKRHVDIRTATPCLHHIFMSGNLLSSCSNDHFSAMDIDQAHEHVNVVIRPGGGAIGITDDVSTLWRWMVA